MISALLSLAAASQCAVTITNANVWTGTGFERGTLGGPATAASVDGTSLWLIPSLVDAHTHTVDEVRGPQDAATHVRMLRSGILYAVNPNNIRSPGPTPEAAPAQVALEATGGGVTGPGGHPRPLYTNMARRGWLGPGVTIESLAGRAFHEAATPEEARAAVGRVHANGAKLVKLYLLDHDTPHSAGLSGAAFDAAADEARKLKLRALVHVESRTDFARAAAARVAGIVHTPYQAADSKRTAESRLIDAVDARAAAAAGIVVVPTLTPALGSATGDALLKVRAVHDHNLRVLRDAGVMLAVGADNYGSTMLDELLLLRLTGLFSADQLLTMATVNGRRLSEGAAARADVSSGEFIGYFSDPTRPWSMLGDPVVAMRAGRLILDDAGLLAKPCGAPALKSKWAQ